MIKIEPEVLNESLQLLVVTTDQWDAINGSLQRYEREDATHRWVKVGEPVSIVVGRNGMAWGYGIHEVTDETAIRKREGDGKAPAGLFRIGHAFGFASPDEAGWINLPYTHVTQTLECVDDKDSEYYNRIVDREAVSGANWSSSEKMAQIKTEYRWGIVIQQNMNPVRNGCGSCVFLHIWKDQTTPTAGCTAMEPDHIEILLRWLKPEAKPLLVQMPDFELKKTLLDIG